MHSRRKQLTTYTMKDIKPIASQAVNSLEQVIQHGFFLALVVVAPLTGLYLIISTIIDLLN